MAKMSRKIAFYDEEKIKNINSETIKLWNKYKIDMSIRELSENTINGYWNDIQQWCIYIYDNQDNKCITELSEDDITEFLYYCKMQGNNTRRMKRRMSSISAFYKFLRKKRIINQNPMEFIDRPKKDSDIITQTFLTKEQVSLMKEKLNEFVKNAITIKKKHYALQLQAYALFSLSTMARVTAVGSVKWKQCNFENRIITDVVEKEGYLVDLYPSKEVVNLLRNLKQFRVENNIEDNGYIFISTYNNKITTVNSGTFNQWCKVIGDMIGVPTLHCHDFRHSGATLLKNSGMELEEISKLLNHKSTDVTSKFYIKFNANKLKENKDKYEI